MTSDKSPSRLLLPDPPLLSFLPRKKTDGEIVLKYLLITEPTIRGREGTDGRATVIGERKSWVHNRKNIGTYFSPSGELREIIVEGRWLALTTTVLLPSRALLWRVDRSSFVLCVYIRVCMHVGRSTFQYLIQGSKKHEKEKILTCTPSPPSFISQIVALRILRRCSLPLSHGECCLVSVDLFEHEPCFFTCMLYGKPCSFFFSSVEFVGECISHDHAMSYGLRGNKEKGRGRELCGWVQFNPLSFLSCCTNNWICQQILTRAF